MSAMQFFLGSERDGTKMNCSNSSFASLSNRNQEKVQTVTTQYTVSFIHKSKTLNINVFHRGKKDIIGKRIARYATCYDVVASLEKQVTSMNTNLQNSILHKGQRQ